MKRVVIFVVFLLSLSSCATHLTFGPEELNKNLVYDAKIRKGVLENGMRYMIRQNSNPEQKVEFRFGVDIGSLQEGEDELGAAHFIEHMAFNGTEHFSQEELLDFFQENGMEFGADLNASTSHTRTIYRFSLPADQNEVIDKGFIVLKDWANGIKFEREEVDRERNIILEEIRARKSANKRVQDKVMRLVYGPSWSHRHPIGKESVIESIGHQKLQALYKKWYQPGVMSVVVVGDIDVGEMESKIRAQFSGLKKSEPLLELKKFDIPKYKKVQYLSVEDPELTQSFIKIYQHVKTKKLHSEGDLRRYLVENIYISVLYNRLKEKSLSSFSSHDQLTYFQDWLTPFDKVFYLGARVKHSQFEQSLEEILIEFERLRRYGVLDSEIKDAKKIILKNCATSLKEEDTKQSGRVANKYIHKSLDNNIVLSVKVYNRLCKKYLPSIEADDVNLFLNTIALNDKVIACQGNLKANKKFLDQSIVESSIEKIRAMEIGLYSPKEVKEGISEQALAKGNIVKTTYFDKANVTVLELSNGAKVVLKPTLFKRDDIVFKAYSPGGLSLLDPKFIPLMELADPIFKQSGLGPFTKLELWSKLKSKKIRASIYVGAHEEGIMGFFSPKNLKLFFKLITIGLSNPRFERKAFKEQKKKFIGKKRNAQQLPFYKLQEKILQTSWHESPFNRMITPEAIEKLEFYSSKKALQGRFKDAGDFTFQFVGNFKMHEIIPLIKKHIAGLPAGQKREKQKNIKCKPLPGKFVVSVDENLENKSIVIINLIHYYTISEKKLFEVSALKTILKMKINEILREDQRLIYSGNAYGKFYSLKPSPHSVIGTALVCAPENVDKVILGVKTILNDLRNTILSDEKISQIKEIQFNQAKEARQKNSWWSHAIKDFMMLGQNLNDLMEHEKYIMELTPDKLQSYASKYLAEDNMLTAILNPKKGESGD
jgi:zinc protease